MRNKIRTIAIAVILAIASPATAGTTSGFWKHDGGESATAIFAGESPETLKVLNLGGTQIEIVVCYTRACGAGDQSTEKLAPGRSAAYRGFKISVKGNTPAVTGAFEIVE